MLSILKYGFYASVLAGAAYLFVGPDRLVSFAKRGEKVIKQKLDELHGFESRLDDVRSQLDEIDAEIRDHRKEVIERKVDVEQLTQTIMERENELQRLRRNLEKAQELLSQESTRYMIGGVSYTFAEVEQDADIKFNEYQTKERTLKNLRDTLRLKEESLAVSEANVTGAIARKGDLEGQIRLIAAELERFRARQIYVECVDQGILPEEINTELGKAEHRLGDLKKELAVKERMLDERVKAGPGQVGGINYERVSQDAQELDIATRIRRYFLPESIGAETSQATESPAPVNNVPVADN